MRIKIKTDKPIQDKDVKALHVLQHAMTISSERMREANLRFIAERWGFKLVKP